jgi:hypothetical protein
MFVEDMDEIVGSSSRVNDRILVLGDFNLPKVQGSRRMDPTCIGIKSDLIKGMLCSDLGQINSIPYQNGTFLNLIFSNASTDITVEICESPILGLARHHRAYELLVDVRLCKCEATSMDERWFRFRAADCKTITDELGLVDWHGLFSRKGVDLCVDLFYDAIWSSQLRMGVRWIQSTRNLLMPLIRCVIVCS